MNEIKIDIEDWLRKIAHSIECPLSTMKFKKKYCDVVLGVELYKMRYIDTFYPGFVIYNKDVSDYGKSKPDGAPIMTKRMIELGVSRLDGSHPEFALDKNDDGRLPYLREQIVTQGNCIFQNVYSLSSLLRAYRGQVPEAPIERGDEATAHHIAEKIEVVLSR